MPGPTPSLADLPSRSQAQGPLPKSTMMVMVFMGNDPYALSLSNSIPAKLLEVFRSGCAGEHLGIVSSMSC